MLAISCNHPMQVIVKRSEEKQRKVKRGREKTSRVKNRDMEEGKRGGEKGREEGKGIVLCLHLFADKRS